MNGAAVGDAEKGISLGIVKGTDEHDPSLETIDHGRRRSCCRRPCSHTLRTVVRMHFGVGHLDDDALQRQTFAVRVHPQCHGCARAEGGGE